METFRIFTTLLSPLYKRTEEEKEEMLGASLPFPRQDQIYTRKCSLVHELLSEER